MIKINEFMTSNPYTLSESDSLEDARKLMTEKHIRHIPITDDENHVRGLVTQRDVLEATDPGSRHQQQLIKLADIMIKDVSVIHESDSIRQAAIFLQNHKYGCLPVVANNALVGIITDSDYIDIAINLLEQVEVAEDNIDFEEDGMDDVELPVLEEEL